MKYYASFIFTNMCHLFLDLFMMYLVRRSFDQAQHYEKIQGGHETRFCRLKIESWYFFGTFFEKKNQEFADWSELVPTERDSRSAGPAQETSSYCLC